MHNYNEPDAIAMFIRHLDKYLDRKEMCRVNVVNVVGIGRHKMG